MIRLYTDENVLGPIVSALRARGIDVLTAWEDGRAKTDDRRILDRATELNRVLFSQDADLLIIATARQRAGDLTFSGVIYAHQNEPIGQCVDALELMVSVYTYEELLGEIRFVPL